METFRGTFEPLQQRWIESYDPSSGHIVDREWAGFDINRMRAFARRYAKAGCSYELSYSKGKAVLRATDNSRQVTIDTWEVGVSEVLLTSIINPRNIATISATYLKVIARAVKEGTTIAKAGAALSAETGTTHPVDISDDAEAVRLYGRMLSGNGNYIDYQYSLRHTTNVPNRWDVNVADENIGKIYTTAQLLSEVEDDDAWIFPLPGRLSYKLQAIEAPASQTNYLWGWLKGASPESSAPHNRTVISTEYKLFMWSTDEYGEV